MVLFPTYDAPHYKYGYQIISMFGVLAMLGTAALKWQSKRDGYVMSNTTKFAKKKKDDGS